MEMFLGSILGLATKEATVQMTKGDGTSLCQAWERNRKGGLYQGKKDGPGYTGEKLVLDLEGEEKRKEKRGRRKRGEKQETKEDGRRMGGRGKG